MIQELNEELADEMLKPTDCIYVLREEKTFKASIPAHSSGTVLLNVITDWFYGNEEEIDYSILHEDEIESIEIRRDQYIKCKDRLEEITLEACLKEMEDMNRII